MLAESLESLMDCFVDRLSQVFKLRVLYAGTICLGRFRQPDGLGHREFRLDVGRRDDGQSGSQRAVIEPCVKQGGSQSLDGDAVAVRSRDALDEAVQAQTTQVVGDTSGADLARLKSEQGSEVLAEIFVGDGPLDEEERSAMRSREDTPSKPDACQMILASDSSTLPST